MSDILDQLREAVAEHPDNHAAREIVARHAARALHALAVTSDQAAFCKANGMPCFMPMTGVCGKEKHEFTSRITRETAKSKHVTGCPACPQSWCE